MPRFQGNPQYLKERNVVKSCKVSKKLQHFEIKEEIDRGIFSRAMLNCTMLDPYLTITDSSVCPCPLLDIGYKRRGGLMLSEITKYEKMTTF